jgi:hypothetical protein
MVYHGLYPLGPAIEGQCRKQSSGKFSGKILNAVAPIVLHGGQRKPAVTMPAPRHRRAAENSLMPPALCSLEIRPAATRALEDGPVSFIGRRRLPVSQPCQGEPLSRLKRLVRIFAKEQQSAPAAPGTQAQTITASSGRRIQKSAVCPLCLCRPTFSTRCRHKNKPSG